MSETKQLRTMRVMAWQRAKGELYSMLETFWSDAENYDALDARVETGASPRRVGFSCVVKSRFTK